MWPALILVLLAHAISDVLHHPFLGDTGDAATVDVHLTLWVPGTEAGGPSEAVAREAAASLQLTGRPATVKLVRTGGAAGAVANFLGGDAARSTDLLVVSSATVADLVRGRSDALFGDEALQAADAEALLRRARPLAVLAQDRLQLAVRMGSHLRSGAQLMAALRTNPRSHLLAVEGDAWTKVNLGRLVQRAGVPGRVPYRAFPSAGEAALGLESGDADVVLAPSSELRAEVAGGRLRVLPWPSGTPPRRGRGRLCSRSRACVRGSMRGCATSSPGWPRTLTGVARCIVWGVLRHGSVPRAASWLIAWQMRHGCSA